MSEKDRKAEIERRKKRLEELRHARDEKKKEVRDKEVLTKGAETSGLSRERDKVNKLVDEILGPSIGTSTSPVPPPSVSPTPSSSSTGSIRGPDITETQPSSTPTKQNKKQIKLTVDQLLPINIKPKVIEVYEKHTQTILGGDEIVPDPNNEEAEVSITSTPKKVEEPEEDKRKDTEEMEQSFPIPHTLTEENKQLILQSEDFAMFIERSSLVMERALAESSDILFDLSAGRDTGGENDVLSSINVVKKRQFVDERWSKGRMVSSIAWSPHHSGIVVASYYQIDKTTSDPDGVVLMWDLKFKKDTPDYVFNCHSSVMSVTFSKFHPNFVIGGTYSGQIVLWDVRSGKRTPVQRSLLSSSGHTHPIYCLEVIGSQNAHNLISVSTDGRLCSWNLDNLSQPQESLDLQSRHPRAIAVTSLAFPVNEVNKFVVGSEEGMVYQGQRHGKKPGVIVHHDGHYGTVTSVSCHKATNNQNDFSHLFLSSSFDWTIKLWSMKLMNEQQITNKTATQICSFETNNDYVYDVEWSPIHPALFVSVNGEGHIDFWNINHDPEVPILTESVDVALCKVRWGPNGQLLVVGDVDGTLHIYEAGEALCVPQAEDWSRLQQAITELQQAASGETM